MKNDLLLFDPTAFERRKTADQTEFERQNLDLLVAFPGIVDKCFDKLCRDVYPVIDISSRDKNMPATVMSGLLKGELIRQFPEYCREAPGMRFRLKANGGEWVYIKKLNEYRRPSNIPTMANNMIVYQRTDSHIDMVANLFLGYTSREMTFADDVFAVYLRGKETIWASNLRDLAGQNTTTTKQMPQRKEPELKEGLVGIKPKRRSAQ